MSAVTYDALTAQLLPRIARWVHASFVLNTLEPFDCERSGWKPGRILKRPSRDQPYSYGYDAEGRLLVSREGQFEYLHLHEKDQITRIQFDRSAIAWATKQKWSAEEQTKAKSAKRREVLRFEQGRLVRVERRAGQHDDYEYDAQGRVVRVLRSEPKHTEELSYDEAGELSRVVWRSPSGHGSDRYRRAAKGDELDVLLPKIHAALRVEIPKVLAERRLREPVYCVVLSVSLEEAPHLLPPRLSVGLVSERDRVLSLGGRYAKSEIWNPEAMTMHDDPRLEDPDLVALCDRANVAREDDTPVLIMLRELATELSRGALKEALPNSDDLVVYAMDVGSEGGAAAAARMLTMARRKKLVSRGFF